jgi:hypothetical protein
MKRFLLLILLLPAGLMAQDSTFRFSGSGDFINSGLNVDYGIRSRSVLTDSLFTRDGVFVGMFGVDGGARLKLAAADSAGNLPPFRFTTGTKLTATPQTLSIETNGDSVFFTNASGVRYVLGSKRADTSSTTSNVGGWTLTGLIKSDVAKKVYVRGSAGDTVTNYLFNVSGTSYHGNTAEFAGDVTTRDTAWFQSTGRILKNVAFQGTAITDTYLAKITSANKVSGNAITDGTIGGTTVWGGAEITGANKVNGTAISGTITGAILQTAASPNARVAMTSTGIGAWNSSNTQTVQILNNGSGWFGLSGTQAISWSVAGVVTAGGFTLSANSLSTTSGGNTVALSTGSDALIAGPTGSPTFTLTQAGMITAYGAAMYSSSSAAKTAMTSSGFGAWNSSGTQTMQILNTGAGWFGTSGTQALSWTSAGVVTAGGFTISTSALYTGSKTDYNDANAGVHLGTDGIGIGNNVFTVSSAGALVATSATITGAITASSGTISGSLLVTGGLQTAASPNARVVMTSVGIGAYNSSNVQTAKILNNGSGWLGASTSLAWTVDGVITAGGWTIGATSLTDAAGTVGMSSAVTGGDDIRFWAGNATPASAAFRITEAGALTATNATITGTITGSTLTTAGSGARITIGTASAAAIQFYNSTGDLGSVAMGSSYLTMSAPTGIYFSTSSQNDLYHNGYKIWNAANMGTGSTLDADLLDGSHKSAFYLTSDGYVTSAWGTKTATSCYIVDEAGAPYSEVWSRTLTINGVTVTVLTLN